MMEFALVATAVLVIGFVVWRALAPKPQAPAKQQQSQKTPATSYTKATAKGKTTGSAGVRRSPDEDVYDDEGNLVEVVVAGAMIADALSNDEAPCCQGGVCEVPHSSAPPPPEPTPTPEPEEPKIRAESIEPSSYDYGGFSDSGGGYDSGGDCGGGFND